jgi:hypothetical protein
MIDIMTFFQTHTLLAKASRDTYVFTHFSLLALETKLLAFWQQCRAGTPGTVAGAHVPKGPGITSCGSGAPIAMFNRGLCQ